MSTSKALELAKLLEENDASMQVQNDAAIELRHLHAVNKDLADELRVAIKAFSQISDSCHWSIRYAQDMMLDFRDALDKMGETE